METNIELKLRIPRASKVLNIADLKFDPKNVRLFHKIMDEDISQDQLFNYIKRDEEVTELKNQIINNKKLVEELIVDSNNTVIEGNRRLAALKLIEEDPNLSLEIKDSFKQVKCRILPQDTTEEEKLLYVSIIHVHGKKPWKPIDKAEAIHRLYTEYKETYDEISRQLGIGKATISRVLNSYEATLRFKELYSKQSKTNWWEKYTFFDELFKRKDLKLWRNDPSNIDKFSKWVAEEKFHDVRDVRRLHIILQDKFLLDEFEKGDMNSTYKLAASRMPSLTNPIFKKIYVATEVIQEFSRKDLIEILQDPLKENLIKNLHDVTQELIREIESAKKSWKKGGE